MGLINRIQHAWNAFTTPPIPDYDNGFSSWYPTYKRSRTYGSNQFVSPIYNRIAIDVSMAKIRHVKSDPETEDITPIDSGLNYCLNVEANLDQTGIQFMHDLVYSMFDEGVVAVVPVETSISPTVSGSFEIRNMRVGKVVQWYPKHVRINLYNEEKGQNEDIMMAKSQVALIENPLYAVMNAENSTLKRLTTKIGQLDDLEALSASGKMDLIVQVPYAVKSKTQIEQAEKRIRDIEAQLTMGRHGITYMDATEKVTQLSRPLESNLPATIESLSNRFYNQLGLTQSIFDGTASEEELRLYYSRTIDPIIEHIIAEMYRKFLTKTARTQGHELQYYRDMFKFVTVEMISSLGDTVRRNSILTANEVRKILGVRPSNDPNADVLSNPNIADKNQNAPPGTGSLTPPEGTNQMSEKLNKEGNNE